MSARPALSPASTRHLIEDEIERLIALLDQIDSDPDLEPWLAGELAPGDLGDDREEECEDEGSQCDDEGVIESGIADEDALLAPYRIAAR